MKNTDENKVYLNLSEKVQKKIDINELMNKYKEKVEKNKERNIEKVS